MNADEPNPLDFAHYSLEVSMTRGFVPVRRIAALSVALALFAAPLASAQTPEATPSGAASANTKLLSPAAFARLIQPPATDVGTAPIVAESPRPSLHHQVAMSMARQTQSAPAKAPQQKSWASRHKTAIIVSSLIGGAVALGLTAWWIASDHFCC